MEGRSAKIIIAVLCLAFPACFAPALRPPMVLRSNAGASCNFQVAVLASSLSGKYIFAFSLHFNRVPEAKRW